MGYPSATWRMQCEDSILKLGKKQTNKRTRKTLKICRVCSFFCFFYPDEFVLFLNSVVQYTIGSVKQESGVTIQNQCKLLFTKRKSLILFGKAAKTRFLNSWLICFKCFNVCIQFCCNELWQTLDIFFKGVQYGIALNRV